jgi:hypothetical protein
MRRIFVGVAGLSVAMGLALQPAQAGERKSAAVQVRHLGAAVHNIVFAAQARSAGDNFAGGHLRQGYGGPRELSFVPVSPLGTEVRGQKSEVGSPKGPSTSPRERKSLTFFRLDPKFGDVSVQPVVGGVNGAQVSLGF